MTTLATRWEFKAAVSPTRDGWRYVILRRKAGKGAWVDFPPYRTFTTRAEAEAYLRELEG